MDCLYFLSADGIVLLTTLIAMCGAVVGLAQGERS